jgi:hypothetical protein
MTIIFGSPTSKDIEADRELRYEHLSEVFATAYCPGCGKPVELVAETDAWEQDDEGNWKHSEYGPATGFCKDCRVLIVDTFDGCYFYH